MSLRQLDSFLEMMTSAPLFRTPASSPPKYSSPGGSTHESVNQNLNIGGINREYHSSDLEAVRYRKKLSKPSLWVLSFFLFFFLVHRHINKKWFFLEFNFFFISFSNYIYYKDRIIDFLLRYIAPTPIQYKSSNDGESCDIRNQLSPTSPNSKCCIQNSSVRSLKNNSSNCNDIKIYHSLSEISSLMLL